MFFFSLPYPEHCSPSTISCPISLFCPQYIPRRFPSIVWICAQLCLISSLLWKLIQAPPFPVNALSTRSIGVSWAFQHQASVRQIARHSPGFQISCCLNSMFYVVDVQVSPDSRFGYKVLQTALWAVAVTVSLFSWISWHACCCVAHPSYRMCFAAPFILKIFLMNP